MWVTRAPRNLQGSGELAAQSKTVSHRSPLQQLICLCLALSFLTGCGRAQGAQDTEPMERTRVLFIGNSYTFYNDLPGMFAELARSGGHKVDVAMRAEPGWTLARHAEAGATLEMIQQESWDYVVLQEQSVHPSVAQEREQHMYPAVRLLDSKISGSGAATILFMTWGRRDGLAEAGHKDFDAMQTQLHAGYMGIAIELGAMVAPVGLAWQNGIAQDPQLELWEGDGSHPSELGSYLAACVLYATIFRQSPEGVAYMTGLPAATGQFLQTVAAETVLEDAERWNVE